MELLFEIIFELFGETLLQLTFEFLAELGCRRFEDPSRPRSPVASAIALALLGAIAGWFSLLVFPDSLIRNLELRRVNLILTPLLIGAIMALIGWARDSRGSEPVRLDRFGYAFVFALAMATVRYLGAR